MISGDAPGFDGKHSEIYVCQTAPGSVRGNHYHRRTSEWFMVVVGIADLYLQDVDSHEQRIIRLGAAEPTAVLVPVGIAHAFANPPDATEDMILVAYANQVHDPEDTIAAMVYQPPV
jgi:dTDP-4-dehydrorhamnose 3,5-epimerase